MIIELDDYIVSTDYDIPSYSVKDLQRFKNRKCTCGCKMAFTIELVNYTGKIYVTKDELTPMMELQCTGRKSGVNDCQRGIILGYPERVWIMPKLIKNK